MLGDGLLYLLDTGGLVFDLPSIGDAVLILVTQHQLQVCSYAFAQLSALMTVVDVLRSLLQS